MSLVSVRKLASRKKVGGEKRVAVKPLLNVQCPPMSLEKVWQAILRQFWRYVRPRVNPKDGFDFNEILWSFLDQSRSLSFLALQTPYLVSRTANSVPRFSHCKLRTSFIALQTSSPFPTNYLHIICSSPFTSVY